MLVILISFCLKLNRFGHRSLWNNLLHTAVRSHLLLFLALFGILRCLWLFVFLLLIALYLPIIDFLILWVVEIFCILILLIFIRLLLVLIFLSNILLLLFLVFLILNHQLICRLLFDLYYHRLWFLSILLLLIFHLIWNNYLASSALFLFFLLPTLLVYVLSFIVIFLRVPVTKTHFLLSGILDTLFFFLFRLLKASWIRVQVSVATRILLYGLEIIGILWTTLLIKGNLFLSWRIFPVIGSLDKFAVDFCTKKLIMLIRNYKRSKGILFDQ